MALKQPGVNTTDLSGYSSVDEFARHVTAGGSSSIVDHLMENLSEALAVVAHPPNPAAQLWPTYNATVNAQPVDDPTRIVSAFTSPSAFADPQHVSQSGIIGSGALGPVLSVADLIGSNALTPTGSSGISTAADIVRFAGSGIAVSGTLPTETQPVNVLAHYAHARTNARNSREAALGHVRRRLDIARAGYTQMSPRDVTTELGDALGVGQLLIARAVGVTPTAVRKWRRGEPARPEHLDRLAQLSALYRVLREVGVYDPASWIDIPISGESTLTPLDLLIGGHSDLAVLYASGLADPQETLDAFNAGWRADFPTDRDYEVVTLADGSRTVVPRRAEAED